MGTQGGFPQSVSQPSIRLCLMWELGHPSCPQWFSSQRLQEAAPAAHPNLSRRHSHCLLGCGGLHGRWSEHLFQCGLHCQGLSPPGRDASGATLAAALSAALILKLGNNLPIRRQSCVFVGALGKGHPHVPSSPLPVQGPCNLAHGQALF